MDPDRRAEIEQRAYDPRREERRKLTRLVVPDDVDARMLDPEARKELRGLTRETADLVARHLVMTGRLLDEDPERALAHARAARAMAGRIGVVRQAAGLAAYSAGEWAEALSELRAARRITGLPEHLSVMADCERALDRPERALAYADDPAVTSLPQEDRVELVIVVAGARRDLGQADAAVLALQDPARRTTGARPWAARLWYAYADALLDAGREGEARTWFEKAADVDADGATDASERLLELDGVVLEDLGDDEDEPGGLADAELAAFVAEAFPRPTVEEGTPAEASEKSDELPAPQSSPSEAQVDSPEDMTSAGAAQPAVEPPDDAHQAVEPQRPVALEQPETAQVDAPAEGVRPAEPSAVPFTSTVEGAPRGAALRDDDAPTVPPAPEPARARPASLMPTFASPPETKRGVQTDPDDDGDDELTLFD